MAKKLVLVVEDEPKQNKILCRIVEEAGYTPVAAHNGLEAFVKLREHRRAFGFLSNKINCILLDWQMPKMRGEQFLKILRREEASKPFAVNIPVAIMTAYDDSKRRSLAADTLLGRAVDYITKPYDKSEVINLLHRILEGHDSSNLEELHRRKHFEDKTLPSAEETEKATERQHNQDMYCQGKCSLEAIAHIEDKKLEAEIEYERCKQNAALPPHRLTRLQQIADLWREELYEMKGNLGQ